MINNSKTYKEALEKTKEVNNEKDSIGYSDYKATSAADNIIIKQNNLIIYLLTQILEKLEKTKPETSEKDLDSITKQFSSLSVHSKKKLEKAKYITWKDDKGKKSLA